MQNQYVQYYGPMGTGNNYTSPLLHTVKLTGLTPSTKYFYQCAHNSLFVSSGAVLESDHGCTTVPDHK